MRISGAAAVGKGRCAKALPKNPIKVGSVRVA